MENECERQNNENDYVDLHERDLVSLGNHDEFARSEARRSVSISREFYQQIDEELLFMTQLPDLRDKAYLSPMQVLEVVEALNNQIAEEFNPANRSELFLHFKSLFQEVILNLNLMKSNEML